MLPISAAPQPVPAQNGPEPHAVEVEQVYTLLGTVANKGLTPQIVASRLQTDGPNAVRPPKGTPMIFRFIKAIFLSGFAPILWIADGLAFAIYPPPISDPANPVNLALGLILMTVLLFSGGMDFWQELKTDQTLSAFQKRLAHSATVIREGELMQVPTADLVRGDIVELGTGDKVPADLRIIHSSALSLNNSPLTGETKPISATTAATTVAYNEATNMAWMGATVVAGNGKGVIVSTGEKTRIGHVMRLTGEAKPGKTTLETELLRFVLIIAGIALGCCIFCVTLWCAWLNPDHSTYMSLAAMLSNIIGLCVGAIPTGLPISVTLTLVVMIRRLLQRHNVLAKQLNIIDTLGCMNMLLSDKTGTLTTGIMSLEKIVCVDQNNKNEYAARNFNLATFAQKTPYSDRLLQAMILCNSAELTNTNTAVNGNPTDLALMNFIQKIAPGYVHQLREMCPTLAQIPFSSSTKVMLTVNQVSGHPTVIVKGAFEMVLDNYCGKVRLPNNEEIPFLPSMLEALHAEAKTLGAQSYRVLAVAELTLDPTRYPANFDWNPNSPSFPKENMTLLGLLALLDPPRSDVPDSVAVLRRAGIKVAMVTGDHPATAEGISRMVGILTRPLDGSNTKSRLVKGGEIAGFNKEEWDSIAQCDELVFARTTPEDKMRIVEQLRERDNVIAVIGDGVNDAPALKMANVGLAMGSGTDVAVEAAKVVLMNDTFTSIPKAVEFGRLSFVNLKKVSIYLLPAGSFSEAIPVLANFALGIPLALSPIFMIVICCLTDVASSMALVLEEAEADIMLQPPRHLKKDRLVNGNLLGTAYCFIGVMESLFAFINYFWYMTSQGFSLNSLFFSWGWGLDGFEGTTAAYQAESLAVGQSVFFITLVVCQLGNLMTTRRRRLPYFYNPKLDKTAVYTSVTIADGTQVSSSTVADKQDQSTQYLKAAARIAICCCASLVIAILCTEVDAICKGIASGPVPGAHWGLAIACSFFIFGANELRKWIIVWYPNGFLARHAW